MVAKVCCLRVSCLFQVTDAHHDKNAEDRLSEATQTDGYYWICSWDSSRAGPADSDCQADGCTVPAVQLSHGHWQPVGPAADSELSAWLSELSVLQTSFVSADSEFRNDHGCLAAPAPPRATPVYYLGISRRRARDMAECHFSWWTNLAMTVEWHRTGYYGRCSPVRTPSAAPLWCDLGFCSRAVVVTWLRRISSSSRVFDQSWRQGAEELSQAKRSLNSVHH